MHDDNQQFGGRPRKPRRTSKPPAEVMIRAIYDKETGAVQLFFKPLTPDQAEISGPSGRAKRLAGTPCWARVPGLPVGWFLNFTLICIPALVEREHARIERKERNRLANREKQRMSQEARFRKLNDDRMSEYKQMQNKINGREDDE